MTALEPAPTPATDSDDGDAPSSIGFTTTYADLVDAMKGIGVAVPTGAPLPALSGALFVLDDDLGVTATGNDGSTTAIARLRPTAVIGHGEMLVDHAEILGVATALVQSVPKKNRDALPVTLLRTADDPVMLLLDGNEVPLETYPPEAFGAQVPTARHTVAVDRRRWCAEAERVAATAGKDDTLPSHTGMFLQTGDDRLEMVATDRFTLSRSAVPLLPVVDTPPAFLTSALAYTPALLKALPFLDGDVLAIGFDALDTGTHPDAPPAEADVVSLISQRLTVNSYTLLRDHFPKPQRIAELLPDETPVHVEADTAALTVAVKRAAGVAKVKKRAATHQHLWLEAQGGPENDPAAGGVRVTVHFDDGTSTTAPLLPARTAGLEAAETTRQLFSGRRLLHALVCFPRRPASDDDAGTTVVVHLHPSDRRATVLTDRADGLTDPYAYRHLVMPIRNPEGEKSA